MSPTRGSSIVVLTALAVFLAGCGGAGGATDRSAGEGTKLFLASDGRMWIVDVEAEQVERLPVPELGAGDPPHRIAPIGDRLALWNYDVTSVPIDDPSEPPEVLARDGWIFIPARDPERIWVAFLDPQSPETERALGELREIDSDGDVFTRGVEPPGGAWPYAELDSGLLFQGPGPIRLWDPAEERTVRTYLPDRIGDMGPVSGDLLASCLDECGELILTDFASGEQRRIPAPSGYSFAVWEGAFSPDGATLAVPVKDAGGGSRTKRELALVSQDGETEIVAGPRASPWYVFTVWSPGGDRVLMTGGGPETRREIISYRLGDERAHALDVEVGDFYDVEAVSGPLRPVGD